jgi:Fe-S cluster assembly protein SufD
MEIQSKDIYTQLFNENKSLLTGDADFLAAIRQNAIEGFNAKGFPAKKDEQYKYSVLEPYFANGFKRYLQPKTIEFNVNDIFRCDVPSLDTHLILLVNGFWYNQTEQMKTLPGGIIVGSLSQAVKQYPDLVKAHLAKLATTADSYVALNTAFITDGLFLYVPKGKVTDKPIQIVNVLISNENLMVQPRNLMVLEPNSEAKIIVCDHTLSNQQFLTNSVTEISVAEGARLNYYKVQNEHNDAIEISHTFVHQAASSYSKVNTITLHGGLVRNNMAIKLDGEGAETNTSGIFLTDNKQHVDNSIFIDHAKPNCTSNQLFKGILDEQSTGAFSGRILVDRDAQKTAAYQRNSNLLLTNEAKMNSKPQLEIYADDVKCSHGATVGQIDEEALFYLRARGIGEKEARLMLMSAFSYEVLHEIDIDPLKDRIMDLVEKRLRGELSRCNNCAIHCK